MKYPDRVVKSGEQDASIVRALKQQLNQSLGLTGKGEKLDVTDPAFDAMTKSTVKLFQARNVDSEGRPLKQDGEVGPLTWQRLFGVDTVSASTRPEGDFLQAVLKTAAAEEARKVREVPMNSNRGPVVEEYLARVHVPAGNPWCCAFVYYCFDEAAKALKRTNPMVRTGRCLDHWNRAPAAGASRTLAAKAAKDPSLVRAGMVFIMDHGSGRGHTGLVEKVAGGLISTIEGNTDASKTREGGGVYRLIRKIVDINKGFIDYSGL
jgi:hypothetical protein